MGHELLISLNVLVFTLHLNRPLSINVKKLRFRRLMGIYKGLLCAYPLPPEIEGATGALVAFQFQKQIKRSHHFIASVESGWVSVSLALFMEILRLGHGFFFPCRDCIVDDTLLDVGHRADEHLMMMRDVSSTRRRQLVQTSASCPIYFGCMQRTTLVSAIHRRKLYV